MAFHFMLWQNHLAIWVISHWDSCLNSNHIILVFLKVIKYVCKTQLSF